MGNIATYFTMSTLPDNNESKAIESKAIEIENNIESNAENSKQTNESNAENSKQANESNAENSKQAKSHNITHRVNRSASFLIGYPNYVSNRALNKKIKKWFNSKRWLLSKYTMEELQRDDCPVDLDELLEEFIDMYWQLSGKKPNGERFTIEIEKRCKKI